ncbi:MAG: hypothetical protein ISN26_05350 [Betaproteobacteria bacterium AqS2]|uniref:Uncharacterized protein n=1 Tax=Candidatus Amphirhobacter heronislandensis TaxID=1732024 RepID=A0A930XWV8_9GAMM|nr:hypothetical protein [Betaproteobacteria bacterium AqS2]
MEELVDELVDRPYGLREGVIPLYFAAGLMAFGRCLAIKDADGAYLPDILATEIDAICARPADYTVDVYEPQPKYLSALTEAFHGEAKEAGDQLRQFHDALTSWREQLPEGALKSRPKDPGLRRFRDLVARASDPARLAFEQFPELAGGTNAAAVRGLLDYRIQLDSVKDRYTSLAIAGASRIITAVEGGAKGGDLLQNAAGWARSVEQAVKKGFADERARQVVSLALGADSGRYSEASFARSLATLFGREIDKWNERTPDEFEALLQAAVASVEDHVLASPNPPKRAAPIIVKRLRILGKQLRRLAAPAEARKVLQSLMETTGDGKKTKR